MSALMRPSTDQADMSRTQRSIQARRVSGTLEQLRTHGTFDHLDFGKARVGRITHRIHGHHQRTYRFVHDLDADAVTIPSLLPATLPPALHREVRCVLRPIVSHGVRDGMRLDPEKGELRVFQSRGSLTLSITIRNDAYEYCTDHLIRLADDVLRALLGESAAVSDSSSRNSDIAHRTIAPTSSPMR